MTDIPEACRIIKDLIDRNERWGLEVVQNILENKVLPLLGAPIKPEDRQCRNHYKDHFSCPFLEETGGGFRGEKYECDVCGYSIFLDYDDMK